MNTKTVLLTGSRAPVTLDLARSFWQEGWRVVCADSFSVTLCQYSRCVHSNYLIQAPSDSLSGFAEDLKKIILKEKVDLLIPMCEEVLYISMIIGLLPTNIFTQDFKKIKLLHNKWSFSVLLEQLNLKGPTTFLISEEKNLKNLPRDKKLIFKQVYSRFAANIKVLLPYESFPKINFNPRNPFVAQEFIEGEGFCSYSVVNNGNIMAHAEYKVLQSIGIGSAITFQSSHHEEIYKFVADFSKKTQYHGQLSFDFIQSKEGGFYCIECNPRATSGLHLFERSSSLARTFFQNQQSLLLPKKNVIFREVIFSLWYGLKNLEIFNKPFWKNLYKGKSPVYASFDKKPVFSVPIILYQIMKLTLLKKKGFHEVMSRDVEYNGDIL